MRAKTLFTMALTPFILSAAPQKAPQMKKSTEEAGCHSPFHAMHVDVRHTESKGVGYKDGYTTLEGFGIYDHNPYFMPFLDLRGHVFNDGQLAGNVGLGERTFIPSINHIFGAYLYYDVRQEDHGLTVNQLSPGIEMLGKRMEYRINAYFPVGKHESHAYHHKFDKFKSHRMILKSKKKYAMTGVDGEVGAHITQSTRHDFYFGIGPYYFTAHPNNAWGGKTRLYWRYKDYVSLEASYSYDHIFKNVVQGTVAFSYPFGKKLERKARNCSNSNDLALSRAAFAPYRFEIPVVETHTQRNSAINPNTGQPVKVWFVSNTSSSAGTYESPFPTLAEAQNASGPNDMIYIFPGNGTTTGMNTGIVLKNGQTLYGSGTAHLYTTQQGNIQIPALSSATPTLTNAGDVVTLANGNEVSGLNLFVTQLAARAVNGRSGAQGANINHNTISGNVDHTGVDIFGDNIRIKNNRFTNNPSGSTFAINVNNFEITTVDMEISDNIISGYWTGILVSPSITPTESTGYVIISGNQVTNFNRFGINYAGGMTDAVIQITNNTLINNIGLGSTLAALLNDIPNAGNLYIIRGNNISSTAPISHNGILAQLNLPNGTSSRMLIDNNNVTTGPVGGVGIAINTAATDTFCIGLTNNTVRLGNTGSIGLSLAGGTGTINVANLSNNLIPNILTSGNVNLVAPDTCGQ